MMDLVAPRIESGEIFVNLARRHIANHEWGRARKAIEQGLAKGGLQNREHAIQLLSEIGKRLG